MNGLYTWVIALHMHGLLRVHFCRFVHGSRVLVTVLYTTFTFIDLCSILSRTEPWSLPLSQLPTKFWVG